MQLSIRYGTKTIEFHVEYKNRKTMEISVEPPNKVFVVAPLGTSEQVIRIQSKKQSGVDCSKTIYLQRYGV